MADEKKNPAAGADQPKTHMTVTGQTVVAMAIVGLILGLIVASMSKDKPYAMLGGIFAVFAAVVTVGAQFLDVKAFKTKEQTLVPVKGNDAGTGKGPNG